MAGPEHPQADDARATAEAHPDTQRVTVQDRDRQAADRRQRRRRGDGLDGLARRERQQERDLLDDRRPAGRARARRPPPPDGAGGAVIVYANDASGLTLPAGSIAMARIVSEWSTEIGVTPNAGDAAAGFVPTVV